MTKQSHLVLAGIALFLVLGISCGHGHHHHHHRHLQDVDLDGEVGRCGTEDPTDEESEAMYNQVKEWLEYYPDALTGQETITICTWVHVIEYSDGTGGVTDEMIEKQIRVLNEGFKGDDETDFCGQDPNSRPSQGGVTTAFEFALAGVTRTRNDAWAIWLKENELAPKSALRRGDEATLNLYVAPVVGSRFFGAVLGYATFPYSYITRAIYDGVVLTAGTLPGGAFAPYNEGDTGTHEVGHWLGLYHTFQGGCIEPGDGVDDTPAQAISSAGCPTAQDTCPSPGLDPVTNFMDYSDDCCMSEFTADQSARMLASWDLYRGSGEACVPSPPPPPPDNDMCSTATEVSVPSSILGSTMNATIDGDITPLLCGTPVTAPGVWYKFTASQCGVVEASTCVGTTYDSKLNIYGGTCEELECVAGNDNGCGVAGPAIATFEVEAGMDYYVLVQGYNSAMGNFNLTLTETDSWDCANPPTEPSPTTPPPPTPLPPPPDNDMCTNATEVSVPSSNLGSTISATEEDVSAPFCATNVTAPGVWYRVTASQCGKVEASTCVGTNYDAIVNVYSNGCDQLECVAGNDNGCGFAGPAIITFEVGAGMDYYVLVQGFLGATGDFNLTLTETDSWDCENPPTPTPAPTSALPDNDMCSTANEIAVPSSTMGSTTRATMDGDDGGPFCGTEVTAPGIWYVFTATNNCKEPATGTTTTPKTQQIEVSTCTGTFFDTRINVYTGSCDALECVAGDDDGCSNSSLQSLVTFDAQQGTQYYILVQGFMGATGDFELNIKPVGNEHGGC